MSANTILTSTVTAGTNNHTTSAEEANVLATDFVTQGVVGAITLNTGSGGTGSFCVNQNTGSDSAIIIKAGQAYISATPSSQGAQVLRARAAADYTAFPVSSNSSGSTKYDWVYLKVDPTKANNPASDASDVTSIVVSRSSSNTTDNGTPPTYGINLAIITVANGATAITNSLITDKRVNASVGAQNGSLIVTQASTGTDAIVQAAGVDANVNLNLKTKGTGYVEINSVPLVNPLIQVATTNYSAVATGTTIIPIDDTIPQITEGTEFMTQAITPKATTNLLSIEVTFTCSCSVAAWLQVALFQDSTANALAATGQYQASTAGFVNLKLTHTMSAGTTSATTFRVRGGADQVGTFTFNGSGGARRYGGITLSNIKITEHKV
jgi:hypothetical protein